jgi:hypothetical protein
MHGAIVDNWLGDTAKDHTWARVALRQNLDTPNVESYHLPYPIVEVGRFYRILYGRVLYHFTPSVPKHQFALEWMVAIESGKVRVEKGL